MDWCFSLVSKSHNKILIFLCLPLQNGSSQATLSSEVPGIYRQTTETTGTYSPLKKHLHRAHHIVPSRNCSNQKVIPSHPTPKRCLDNDTNSDSSEPFDRHYEPFGRPYTPPEKRYSSNFGLRLPERKFSRQRAYVYENVHANDFCGGGRGRTANSTPNVKIREFPDLEFNQTYIQKNAK